MLRKHEIWQEVVGMKMRGREIGLVCALATTVFVSWAISGCGERPNQAERLGKETATAMLKKLPQFQQFEWILVRYVMDDRDMRRFARPDEAEWAASDGGGIFNELGLSRDNALDAEWVAEMGSDERICVVWTWSDPHTISSVQEHIDLPDDLGFGAAARVENSILLGDETSIKEVSGAMSGTKQGRTMWDDPVISKVWAALPPGFSMVVGTGTEHTFVSQMGERVQGWGQSTTKLDAESARTTFVAHCVSTEITEDVCGDVAALLTSLEIEPEKQMTRGPLVIVSFKNALSEVRF